MLKFLESLQETEISRFLQSSTWAFPAVETLHILSFAVLVGSATLWDLRLLGLFRKIDFELFKKPTLTVARWGFGFAVPTGVLLFVANPIEMFGNISFRMKMLLLILALFNITVFHLRNHKFGRHEGKERIHAIISLVLWASIITAGRWIAYV